MESPDRQACVSLDRSKANVLLSAEADWGKIGAHWQSQGADLPEAMRTGKSDAALESVQQSRVHVIE